MNVAQEARHVGEDLWDWAVWIGGSDAELDEIDHVEYTLHPTFPQPVRRVRDRDRKFRLDARGWGEFEINARIVMHDGSSQHLKHWLQFEGDDGTQPPRKEQPEVAGPPTVFVSYAAADAQWGEVIRQALADRGFEAVTGEELLEAGAPWQATLQSAIDAADLVVGVFSDAPSSWVEREVQEADSRNTEIVPITVGSGARVPSWLEGRQSLTASMLTDVPPAVDALARKYGL